MDDPINEDVINQSVGHITVVAVFQNRILVVSSYPKYEAPDSALGREIIADQG